MGKDFRLRPNRRRITAIVAPFLVASGNPSTVDDEYVDIGSSETVEIAGTPERIEFEYKLAYQLTEDEDARAIADAVHTAVSALLSDDGKMAFAKGFSSSYRFDRPLEPFVFKDFYLDTPDHQVLQANSSYRLRYRWNRLSSYARHRYLPFLKFSYPIRCEIQFKRGYQRDQTTKAIQVRESRFEFRNAADPFSLAGDAPPAPWPENEYVSYAKSGRFREYRMLPTETLASTLGLESIDSLLNLGLDTVMEVETVRFRTHLSAIGNPWHWGANPDQVFILSLDFSRFRRPNGVWAEARVLEVELEVDRNTSTMLDIVGKDSGDFSDDFSNDEPAVPEGALRLLARRASQKARSRIDGDHRLLRQTVASVLEGRNLGRALATDYSMREC